MAQDSRAKTGLQGSRTHNGTLGLRGSLTSLQGSIEPEIASLGWASRTKILLVPGFRVNFGLQSFRDPLLETLIREHKTETFISQGGQSEVKCLMFLF